MKIVVSRYNEDLQWTKQFSGVIIYNKGEDNIGVEYNVVKLKNVGREGHTYYTHICENYENLDEYIVFLQGEPFHHSPNLIRNLQKYTKIDQERDVDFVLLSEMILDCDLKGCPYDVNLPLIPVYEQLFNERKVELPFRFGAGAQFIVSKRRILSRPREFYENIVKILEYCVHPREGNVIERFHPLIFA